MANVSTTHIQDGNQTQDIFRAVKAQPGLTLRGGTGTNYRVEEVDVEADGLRLRTKAKSPSPERLSLQVYNSFFEIGSEDWRAHGDVVELSGLRVFSANARSEPRLQAKVPVHVSLSSFGQEYSGVVRNLNFHSLGVLAEGSADIWRVGTLVVATLGTAGRTVRGAARVCRVIPQSQGTYLALEFSPDVDRTQLLELVMELRFPRLQKRARVDGAAVTQFMEKTGYSALRPGLGIKADWLALDEPNVSLDRVHVDPDGHLLGHVSLTRGYKKCWVAHQLAIRRHHKNLFDARLDFYRLGGFVVPLLMDGDDAHWLAYFDQKLPWHRTFFQDFVRWMGNEQHSLITDWDRFEAHSSGPMELMNRPPYVEVGLATEAELPAAGRIIEANLPQLALHCMDLDAESLRSDNLHPNYAHSRYARSREVIALRIYGQVVGTALIERGTGLSIFGLFDLAQLFFDPKADIPAAARLELMEYVRNYYEQRGVESPMLVAPAGTFPVSVHRKLCLQETMGQIALSAHAMRHYENFIEFTTPWARDKRIARRKRGTQC